MSSFGSGWWNLIRCYIKFLWCIEMFKDFSAFLLLVSSFHEGMFHFTPHKSRGFLSVIG